MNSDNVIRLYNIAFAVIAERVGPGLQDNCQEKIFLNEQAAIVKNLKMTVNETYHYCMRNPCKGDEQLIKCANLFQLTAFEVLTISLVLAVEHDPFSGRVLSRIQSPVGGARPTLGLLATVFTQLLGSDASSVSSILNGNALKIGIISLSSETIPLPERSVTIPLSLCMALSGQESQWPGVDTGNTGLKVILPESATTAAVRYAASLCGKDSATLAVRSGSRMEARSIVEHLGLCLNKKIVFCEHNDPGAGFGVWLTLRDRVPTFILDIGPSERKRLPSLIGYSGPVLAITGYDGVVENEKGVVPSWTIEVPSPDERVQLWKSIPGLSSEQLAEKLGREHRHCAGRIAQVGQLARHYAMLRNDQNVTVELLMDDIYKASWIMEGSGLDSLAEPQMKQIPDEALVVKEPTRSQLELLALRCRSRDRLADELGISLKSRYYSGVRALFCGPSGTGKTLAAAWLSTRLNLPLYRIDLASVTSKYIGETEKNLSQLLSQAENAGVILLFDEADSLFGKRTDIRDSNDRFANAQTNYLLQRIEHYDGIVIMTSNSQDRFDPAFARRIDTIIDFPLPEPDERKSLWLKHLGNHHTLTAVELNKLSGLLDLAGGNICNAVLTAAVIAGSEKRKINYADIVNGVAEEFRKLGKQLPLEIRG